MYVRGVARVCLSPKGRHHDVNTVSMTGVRSLFSCAPFLDSGWGANIEHNTCGRLSTRYFPKNLVRYWQPFRVLGLSSVRKSSSPVCEFNSLFVYGISDCPEHCGHDPIYYYYRSGDTVACVLSVAVMTRTTICSLRNQLALLITLARISGTQPCLVLRGLIWGDR